MNTDLNLFSRIANHLIYLTTRDEFGSSRSKGIGELEGLTEELNSTHIVPERGFWTENSLKLFFCRIRKRYTYEQMANECDFDFLGRQAWEFQSHTKLEEICEQRSIKLKNKWLMPKEPYPLETDTANSDIESWKPHEIDDVEYSDRKMIKILKS